jgi:hypothetical protein
VVARFRLADLTGGDVEAFLLAKEKSDGLSAQTVNHLRGFLSRAFNAAKEHGRWAGRNPVSEVAKRKGPKCLPDFLRFEEVAPVLAAHVGRPARGGAEGPAAHRPEDRSEVYGHLLLDYQRSAIARARLLPPDSIPGGNATAADPQLAAPGAVDRLPFADTLLTGSPDSEKKGRSR